jgi:hypothetical protein
MVETIHLAHMPPELALHVAMYTDVENASFLKDQLLAGNAEFEYAFIDASMVRCPFPNFPTSRIPHYPSTSYLCYYGILMGVPDSLHQARSSCRLPRDERPSQ